MSIASDHVAFFRTNWTDRLVDTATRERTTAPGAFNPVTLTYAAPTQTTVAVSCLIRYGIPQNQFETFQFGQEATDRDWYTVHLEHDADVLPNDRLVITASDNEPDLIGEDLIIVSVSNDTYNTRKQALCIRKAD